LFGIHVDVIDAKLEPSIRVEESMVESNTSVLTHDQRTEIEDLIDEKLSKLLNMKKPEKKVNQKNFTHKNITCDGCKKGIHNMARFKSLIIDDFDLCEECEAKGIHQGPMVKFNQPSSYNAWRLNQKFREFSQFFKNEESTPVTEEGFQLPSHPWNNHQWRGRRGCRMNTNPQPERPQTARAPNQPCPFFQNLTDTIKPFGFGNLLKNIPNLLNDLAKNVTVPQPPVQTPAPQTQTIPTENKPAEVDLSKKLAAEFIQEFPEMGYNALVLESIIKENKLDSMEAVLNYIL